jgi:hypothetical protein
VAESGRHSNAVTMELNAAIVSVRGEMPLVLSIRQAHTNDDAVFGLPFGPFEPDRDRTLEIGLRRWVQDQAKIQLGYVEQLYTFGDRGRHTEPQDPDRFVSVGYLALTDRDGDSAVDGTVWRSCYDYFPWEDHRDTFPEVIADVIRPALSKWAKAGDSGPVRNERSARGRLCFGTDDLRWDDEKTLDRYELLYEAGLVYEAVRDNPTGSINEPLALGLPMHFDHRRILATAMGRLRGKLKYRPVIFEVMSEAFTLLELQKTVEAIAGLRLHKQNFRRLVANSGLVENTGTSSTQTGGRPAQLFRFRKEVLQERVAPGVRLPNPRGRR